jgi:hypothetical protein
MMSVLLFGNVFTKTGRWRMRELVARFGKAVKGVTGFDRIVFKGTVLPLSHEEGAMSFLRWSGVLNRDYKKMNVRLQTWFPYHIQIALNGREWLRRRLKSHGVEFLRQGNKFLHIENYVLAQRYLRQQLDRQWPHLLNSFLPVAFPTMGQTLGPHLSYYWTLWQSEWATDLIMDAPAELAATTASLLRHAWITGNSANVLRYLGRPLTAAGRPHGRSNNEVMSRMLDFHDGLRVRHWVDHNSVKVYNEQNVLRTETTINMPNMFHVYRRAQCQPQTAPKKLRPLRKGVADIPLRAQVSQEVNNRLMDQISTFSDRTPMIDLLAPYVRAHIQQGRRVRALEPSGKDRLQIIAGLEIGSVLFALKFRQRRAGSSRVNLDLDV